MLKVHRKENENVLEIHLTGTIDQSVNFEKIVGAIPKELHLHCEGVDRINSAGAKKWREYFATVREGGKLVRFHECSPALVTQINAFPDFVLKMEIQSVCASFLCRECKLDAVSVFLVSQLKELDVHQLKMTCKSCDKPMIFDDLPEEYFTFLFD